MPPRRTQKVTVSSPTKRAKRSTSTANKGKRKRDAVATKAHSPPVLMSFSRIIEGHPLDVAEDCAVTTGPVPCDDNLSLHQRLATILHGVFLITMTAKAQIGIFDVGQGITAAVDDRWLEAIVRYCGFTVILNDIIETAAAFNDWLKVLVSFKQHGEMERNPLNTIGEEAGLAAGAAKDIILVRLRLLHSSVPSVLEAEAFLRKRWGQSSGWRRNTMSCFEFSKHAETVSTEQFEGNCTRSEAGGPNSDVSSSVIIDRIASDSDGLSDEELLAQISRELRASLSEKKLRYLVAQMRREAIGLDAKEQELVTKRQQRERLLATYDLVRVILGERRSVCSIKQLVQQMVAQNRFRDGEESILKQLASLARYSESGIAIFAFNGDSDGQHPGGVVEGESSSFYSREVDVSQCNMQELEAVLLRLDRHVASRTKLYAALQQR
ncbi:hypothetical protein C3747_33g120 [Trypanosoma cruzi]|uniref:Uncharacterized protein n=2 Tax=Trypanosoma cruzi TaxID=5693 RepID=Q4D3G2_TRYCC|nr:hypothetical protein, conserved [Trypanosoma cruzi]EAN87058.1 hypothetical protein, conserved [Trypanosoma cruzi]PWV14858.1 hypothetical protein C3747_33g120 [Trypanosoma cruzi]RNC60731.1 hypothetical protein TcCL_ESM01554 [Trypanosoma cruzi]|eukprot:XP_808909.1 hypothetical protein [Trypanosoma cruzi strain CL Brener]